MCIQFVKKYVALFLTSKFVYWWKVRNILGMYNENFIWITEVNQLQSVNIMFSKSFDFKKLMEWTRESLSRRTIVCLECNISFLLHNRQLLLEYPAKDTNNNNNCDKAVWSAIRVPSALAQGIERGVHWWSIQVMKESCQHFFKPTYDIIRYDIIICDGIMMWWHKFQENSIVLTIFIRVWKLRKFWKWGLEW